MYRFVAKTHSGAHSLSMSMPDGVMADNMANAEGTAAHTAATPPGSPTHSNDTRTEGGETQAVMNTAAIAEAVAMLLKPMIQEAVETSLPQGLIQINASLTECNKRLWKVEQRVSLLEDETQEDSTVISALEQTVNQLQEKLDDLENRSRRNNLWIVGLPEQYKDGDLYKLCTTVIPKSLGLTNAYTVEWAHRLGGFIPKRKTPRQVIAFLSA